MKRTTLVVAVVGVGLVAATAWSVNDAWGIRRDAVDARVRAERRLATAHARLDRARRTLRRAESDRARARTRRAGADLSVQLRDEQLVATNADVARAVGARDDARAAVDVVRQCIAGANAALDALQRRDEAGTVAALAGVDDVCRAAQGGRSGVAPEYGFDFPDPAVVSVGTDQYAFATNASAGNIQVLHRGASGGWATVGDALATLPTWAAKGATWAPAVLARPGGYVLYFTARDVQTGLQCISRATAARPEGPYVDDSPRPLECGDRGALDPEAVVGTDGTPVLLWKVEGPPRILARPLTADGLAFAGESRRLLAATARWEGSNVEAPSMLVTPTASWLFFSGNDWRTRRYATGVVRCDGPLGPCDDAGPAPLIASGGALVGPGGASVYRDPAGEWRLAYHAYLEPQVGYPASRLLFSARIDLATGRPVVVG